MACCEDPMQVSSRDRITPASCLGYDFEAAVDIGRNPVSVYQTRCQSKVQSGVVVSVEKGVDDKGLDARLKVSYLLPRVDMGLPGVSDWGCIVV